MSASSEVERVLGWFEDGSLVRPSADVANTVALANAVAFLCGTKGIELSPVERHMADAIGPADHYIFVMADGLGMNLIDALPDDSFLRRHVAIEMQSVFPSTTAVALTSLATGSWPAEHAITGWFVYLPDHHLQMMPLPYAERVSKRPVAELGVKIADVFNTPSRVPAFGYEPRSYTPAYIAQSTYSNYSTGGVRTVAYHSLGGACRAISARVSESSAPTYSYLYVPFIDKEEHAHGPHAATSAKVVRTFEQAMLRLHETLSGSARIVISADHGLVHIDRASQHELRDGDDLLQLLVTPPSCEPRVPAFHVRPGQHPQFESMFRSRFGVTHALLTVHEIDELRLFGPMPLSPRTRARLGDYVALTASSVAITYKPDDDMLGFHGGMSRDEMLIPLILA